MKKFKGGFGIKGETAALLNEFTQATGIEDFNLILQQLMTTWKTGAKLPSSSCEEAANLLLETLEPNQKIFVYDVADNVLHAPRWQLIMGCVLLCVDTNMLPSAVINPAWSSVGKIEIEAVRCKNCQGVFKPQRQGQIYCCNACAAHKKVHSVDFCLLRGGETKIEPGKEVVRREAPQEGPKAVSEPEPVAVAQDNFEEQVQVGVESEQKETPSVEFDLAEASEAFKTRTSLAKVAQRIKEARGLEDRASFEASQQSG